MAKKWVMVLGWVFLVIGILGFVPGITSNGHLLGIFEVDTVHNLVHLLSGILALLFAKKGDHHAKKFAQIFGIVYGLVAVIGLFSDSIVGLFRVNMADTVLHIVLALAFLYVGFKGGHSHSVPMKKMSQGGGNSGAGGQKMGM